MLSRPKTFLAYSDILLNTCEHIDNNEFDLAIQNLESVSLNHRLANVDIDIPEITNILSPILLLCVCEKKFLESIFHIESLKFNLKTKYDANGEAIFETKLETQITLQELYLQVVFDLDIQLSQLKPSKKATKAIMKSNLNIEQFLEKQTETSNILNDISILIGMKLSIIDSFEDFQRVLSIEDIKSIDPDNLNDSNHNLSFRSTIIDTFTDITRLICRYEHIICSLVEVKHPILTAISKVRFYFQFKVVIDYFS